MSYKNHQKVICHTQV